MTDENITPEAEVADDVVADLAAEVAEDYSEADYAGGTDFVADADAQFAPVVSSGPAQAVGRRKEAVARVRLLPGSGQFTLNGRSLEDYFPNKVHQQLVKSPLVLVEREEQFDIVALLHGGGPSGQAGALRLAIARALTQYSPDDRPALKKAGFLTRDARAVERKKAGLKKARKAPQYSKR
ncbi:MULTISPECIES: 30S ribosomal protein S9 [Dietzia]|uniref:Small ribosomal subunit protein uS9 n=1 Tax=Dietzia cinnamea TaxID=321318 RepID=A0A177JIV1_9ACTN|nr:MULTISPECIES: 30S ribosomal protein S9 [Dietzia]EFV92944.1 30S ribosomal protein S9 [Dietzia cinnamea P4]MBB1021351.1 30S ribosomal protein S9 [Dietzia sp. E1]MBS7547428.1 30S ribosomal protein S9 [Dietzia massiliensis]OAH41113.1 30S ribosomal protein S9 [Dietzia cinnamea]TCW23749.1 small subunit ribosomal protein S9 [Dietzia cinnamea]